MRERGIKGWSFAKSLNEFMVKNATRTTTLVIPRVFGLLLQTNILITSRVFVQMSVDHK